ncbi:dipeptide epimerase [Gimesia maris]|uniref:Dipeptide epimerase n=1 Tax=Gimesia maris TaxID=122 RepID=A0ABX5YN93_9PLAN|nr:dipeptide epimerase [Gimesia maris]EDL59378.1 chloromuconate cycloisomerase YkfB1 [Gimesia maris DSM 8797]QEG17062.1 L-Ala-D/L-Glu epimerase [Gimesia maris]QGQ29821.1 dipeptide epimerase [Gimesia maris]
MKLFWQRVELPLKDPFTIARGTLRHQQCLIVSLSHQDATGYGEVTCNSYYGHNYESLEASLSQMRELIADWDLIHPGELFDRCDEVFPHDKFALSAIDGAAYDLYGKLHGIPTTEILELPAMGHTQSSYTLGIDSIEEMVRKYREQPGWPVYKVKLGTPHDLEIVQALRQETDATIRVDANCAWTPEQTIANSRVLAELGIEFIEQPLSADAPEEAHRLVFLNSVLPVIADESCRTEPDVGKCHGLFHGINVKLCKCGGLTPASRMLKQARELGMKTMVGCMIESTVGISAAAQLLPLLDYADFDGATLLAEDSARGVSIRNGRVDFSSISGSGIELLI